MSEKSEKGKKESIFVPKRDARYFVLSFVLLAVACIVIWPLMDLLFCKITGTEYEGWGFLGGVVWPCIFALIFTVIEFAFWGFFHKKK